MAKSNAQYATKFFVDLTKEKQANILYVDDDSSLLKVTKQCLEMASNFQVDTTLSVKEAKKKMKKKAYDVIVSDYMMPSKNGLDFLRELRDDGNTIPFIMFTGKGREEVAVQALNLGADQYINKVGDPEAVYLELAYGLHKAIEREKANKNTRESEEKFRNIFESASDAMVYLDKTGRILDVNKKTIEVYGGTKKELVGKHFAKIGILSTREIGKLLKAFTAGLTGKHSIINVCIRNRKGQQVSLECKGSLTKTSGEPMLLVIARDVTKRKQAEDEWKKSEEKLKESEERFRSIVENSHAGIGIVDDKFKIKYINEQVTNIVGYSKEEMIGQDFRKFLPDKPKSLIQNRYIRRQNGEKIPSQYEFETIRKDGKIITVEMKVTTFQDSQGRVQTLAEVIDITDSKRAYEALRESEEKFRNLANQMPNMVFINKKGRVVYVNERCREIMGYTEEEFYSPDFDFLCLIATEDVDMVTSAFKKHMKGEEVTPYEYTLITKEGKRVDAIITTKLVKYDGDNAILGIVTDITERKNAERALKKGETRFRSIVENSHGGIGIVDNNFKVIYINDQITHILGYSKDEIIGQDFRIFLHENCKSLVQNRYLHRQTGKNVPSTYEFEMVRKNGEKIIVKMKAALIQDDQGRTQTLVEILDVTKQKKAVKEILENKKKFERLFMGNPEAAVYVDSNFQILDVNPRFTELFGFSLGEVKGKHVDDIIVPEDKIKEAKMLDKKAESGYVHHDTIRRRKDGVLVSVSISAAPVNIENQIVGHVALYRDISERRKMEEKLRVIGKLTRHDIRNKLSAITGNAYLARKRTTDSRVVECLEEIGSAVRQAEEIFDFASAYENIGVEDLSFIDVGKSFDDAVSLFSEAHDVQIVNECYGLAVLADSLLRQLFYNLIDNSLKHGVKVSKIRVYHEETENQLRLMYEDDGVGISSSEKERIFDEGYGSDTGYGLYLIEKICEVYGWSIRETGQLGRGIEFTIIISRLGNNGKENYSVQGFSVVKAVKTQESHERK